MLFKCFYSCALIILKNTNNSNHNGIMHQLLNYIPKLNIKNEQKLKKSYVQKCMRFNHAHCDFVHSQSNQTNSVFVMNL